MPQIGSLFVSLSMNTAQFAAQSQAAANSLVPIEVNSRKLNFALTNLGFQINDVVSGLVQGQAPMRIFAQQAGQIVQLFTQGGGFRAVARGISDWITPLRVGVGAIAALGVGFAGLILRAQSNSEALRQFNLLLERTGRLASNIDVGAENAQLRALGVSRDTANAQRLAVGRNTALNPAASAVFSEIGANLGARKGIGPEAGFQEFMGAVTAGAEATVNLAVALGALSVHQGNVATTAIRAGAGITEQNKAITAIRNNLKGFATDTMSPMAKAINEVGQAWDKLIETLSKSPQAQAGVKGIGALVDELATQVREEKTPLHQDIRDIQKIRNSSIFQWFTSGNAGAQVSVAGEPGSFGVTTQSGAAAEIARLQQLEKIGAIPSGSVQAVAASGALGGAGTAAAAGFGTGLGAGMAAGAAAGLGVSADLRGEFVVSRNLEHAKAIGDAIQRQREEIAATTKATREWNVEQEATNAAEAARVKIRAMPGATPSDIETAAIEAAAGVRAKFNIELGKEQTLTGMRIESEHKVALAMLESEGAAIRLGAAEQARIDTLQKGGNVAQRTQEALQARAAQAETGLAQGVVADRKEIEAAQLRVSLLGQSTQYIETQIALLRVRQQVEAAGVPVAKEVVAARVAGVNALQGELEKLRQQQILVGQIKEVAGVFENAFSAAFDSIAEGTFNIRKLMNSLLRDLGKTLASQAFKRLLGADESGGGILGSIASKLFGFSFGSKATGTASGPFGDNWSASELGMTGFASGGSFRVGGYGSIDSQLVAFRASPGEMVDVSPGGAARGGGAEIIRIDLNPSEGWVAGVADQRIVTRSGQIVDIAVRQSQRTVQRNFAGMSAEAQARQM